MENNTKFFPTTSILWLENISKEIKNNGYKPTPTTMCILFLIGREYIMSGSSTFKINHNDLKLLHITRQAYYKNIDILNKCKILRIDINVGNCSTLTILPPHTVNIFSKVKNK